MAKLSLTKSGLQKQRNELKLYQKLLPSLDLKRMQLTAELNKGREQYAEIMRKAEELDVQVGNLLPMVADEEIDFSGLVKVTGVTLRKENVVGVKLTVLDDVQFSIFPYSMLTRPHWVDTLVDKLQQVAKIRLEVQVAAERVSELEHAVRRITQRVNLFEKILIPTAKKNIQRIQIFLGDAERSAVVRSKIAKAINQKKRKALMIEGAET
ncbi:V-type ATP synthase subunit D [candidate division KSB3 bacterium]|uniref:V-type ATP synthase subunit D n=1 Tax=candidate division KSB3 bacterium TaxID=2044937 RepID=A0A2G6KGY7_9BACT|nr:MAG: V-type ATP synthase subunit D [candidate division KSB3 bacterium]